MIVKDMELSLPPYLRFLLSAMFLLAACTGSGKPDAVEPVVGLPTGTAGYPWWNDTVFYQIFVRSFYDSNGDGNGDFKGLIEKLDYLNDGNPKTTTDLGVTGIWLLPVNPSPSYHGYDITNYYDVNPDYGSMADFKRLLEEAHKRDIRIIIDLVLNHTSTDHPWFKASRSGDPVYRDWYIWSDTNPGYAGPWGQKVWHSTGKGYYYGIFWSGMPDLNYNNQAVTEQMQDVARFWLDEVGVDGFRLDGAQHLIEDEQVQKHTDATHTWFREFRPIVKETNPQALLIGEVWDTNFAVTRYIKGDQLDLAFNFDLANEVIKAVSSGNTRSVRDGLKFSRDLFPQGQYGAFLTNHDMNRVMSQLGGRVGMARAAASMLLTVPGVPFIYYGEEIGMTGSKPDELIRTPMQWSGGSQAGFSEAIPWIRVNPGFEDLNVESQLADDTSLLAHYRGLIQSRMGHSALRIGENIEVNSSHNSLLTYLRASEKETVLVIINLSSDLISEYNLTLRSGPLNEHVRPYLLYQDNFSDQPGPIQDLEVNGQGGFDSYHPVAELPAYSTLILQLIAP